VPHRVVVAGISGVGKTTLAVRLAAGLGLRHVEVDALFHGPDWQRRPTFEADVDAATRGEDWVADSFGYRDVRDLLWDRCDTFVWMDYGRATVMSRVLRRSFARATYDRELWNGNREGFRDWVDPEHPVRWAWAQHGPRRVQVEARLAATGGGPGPQVVRLASPAAARRWLATLGTGAQR
jgi:adenylate kinase family enzyme